MDLKDKIRLFNGVGSWNSYSANNQIPAITMSDGPHGLRKQDQESYSDLNASRTATCFPTASCIASSWDRNALSLLGASIAKEALHENVQLMLGCGMNIKRSPLCGRNFEYFSEDPFLTGELATSYVNGMQASGVGSCIKHFACNNQEKRRQTSSSNVDEKTLHEIYLRGFEIAVKKSSPAAVMSSYNRVNGIYASHSPYLLNQVLREKWEFNGIVISDWGACIDAPACLKAGMDLAMPDSNGYFDMQLSKAVKDGSLREQQIDIANSRLISTARRLNQMREDAPGRAPDGSFSVDYKVQHKTALDLACKSAVLLRNKGTLPLTAAKNKSLLVIGELAVNMKFQAGGSSHITTASYPDAVESLRAQGFDVEYSPGYYSGFCRRSKAPAKNRPLIAKALLDAKKAVEQNKTILYFCGLTDCFEGEGFDRDTLKLPAEQEELLVELLKITSDLVLVSFSGSPIDLSPAKSAAAILQMYLPGEACGEATALLLAGRVVPSGKLAETWPFKIEDTPCCKNFAPDGDQVDYAEKDLVGYRWYQAKNIPVQFPFGFGLSYTTFEYSAPELCPDFEHNMALTLRVRNTGSCDGAETVQIYVQKKDAPYKKLCGFEKVFVKSGEEETVRIQLDSITFSQWSVADGDFVKLGGEYTLMAAANVDDVRSCVSVTVSGAAELGGAAGTDVNASHPSTTPNHSIPKNAEQFTLTSSLGDMAKKSLRVRLLLKILSTFLIITSRDKTSESPAVKIALSAIRENPLESLISTSGGAISYKFAQRIVRWAN